MRSTRGPVAQPRMLGPVAVVAGGVFLVWNQLPRERRGPGCRSSSPPLALIGGVAANREDHDGLAFTATGVAIAAAVASLFGSLFPDVMPSSTDAAFSLTVENASSTAYTLKIMTWVAVIMTPVVIAYQAWSYWVFRRRIGRGTYPPCTFPSGA